MVDGSGYEPVGCMHVAWAIQHGIAKKRIRGSFGIEKAYFPIYESIKCHRAPSNRQALGSIKSW